MAETEPAPATRQRDYGHYKKDFPRIQERY